MKECPSCKAMVSAETNFCTNCGTSMQGVEEIKKEETKEEVKVETPAVGVTQVAPQQSVTQPKKAGEGLGVASTIIGIISIIVSFISWLFIPIILQAILVIVGITLGIINLAKGGKKFAGLILNIISIVTAIAAFLIFYVFVIVLGIIAFGDPVEGNYKCKTYNGNTESTNYSVVLKLTGDKKFNYASYGSEDSNYIYGDYTYEKEDKTMDGYDYYMITMTPTDNKIGGQYSTGVNKENKYEFAVKTENGKKQGLLINAKTYNMYYCYEE